MSLLARWLQFMRRTFGPLIEEVKVMGRRIFGPRVDGVTVPESLPDLVPDSATANGNVCTVHIPDFEAGKVNVPTAVYAVYGAGGPADGQTADDFLAAAPYQGSAPVAGPGDLAITVPGVPGGTYTVQTVVEFAA